MCRKHEGRLRRERPLAASKSRANPTKLPLPMSAVGSRASRVQSLIDAARSPQRSPLSPVSSIRLNKPHSKRKVACSDGKQQLESIQCRTRATASGSVGACAAASLSPMWSPSESACTKDVMTALFSVSQLARPRSSGTAATAASAYVDRLCGTAAIAGTFRAKEHSVDIQKAAQGHLVHRLQCNAMNELHGERTLMHFAVGAGASEALQEVKTTHLDDELRVTTYALRLQTLACGNVPSSCPTNVIPLTEIGAVETDKVSHASADKKAMKRLMIAAITPQSSRKRKINECESVPVTSTRGVTLVRLKVRRRGPRGADVLTCIMGEKDAAKLTRFLHETVTCRLFRPSRIFATAHRLHNGHEWIDKSFGWDLWHGATVVTELARQLGCGHAPRGSMASAIPQMAPSSHDVTEALLSSFHLRVSRANEDYRVAPTYPAALVVPSSVDDACLRRSAAFRTKGRIPTLTWVARGGAAAIWRSSQPKSGLTNSTSVDDDRLIKAICCASSMHARGVKPRLRIVDCRPKVNAVANKIIGGGMCAANAYERLGIDVRVAFMGIENIHAMSSSMAKLLTLCACSANELETSSVPWPVSVENTRWLQHVRSVLSGSVTVAAAVANGESVLVHCSDGWDRTAQLCSLAQLMLDGYFRTTRGFCQLVEKDWVCFGHRFRQRVHARDDHENSPVFLQFLDCVRQLHRIFPTAFEFSPLLLEVLAHHLYSGCFGTFLTNCERDKIELSGMPSCWALIFHAEAEYASSCYDARLAAHTLVPTMAQIHRITSLWHELYLKDSPAGISLPVVHDE